MRLTPMEQTCSTCVCMAKPKEIIIEERLLPNMSTKLWFIQLYVLNKDL